MEHNGFARSAAVAALLWAAGATAQAHDSWLRQLPPPGAGLLALELGSGARYPKSEIGLGADRITRSGCVDAGGREHALQARTQRPEGLELRARVPEAAALACWLELKPVTTALSNELVQTYLAEIRAPQPVRDAWSRQMASGARWQETYRKFIRIEAPTQGGADAADLSALRKPLGTGLELVPIGGAPLTRGAVAEFQALSDGRPLAGLAVEFVQRRSPLGIWRETDGEGRIRIALPLQGEWLLRGTALEPPAAPDQPWTSRFSTLTVDVR